MIFLEHGTVFKPVACIITLHARSLAIIIMSREEWLVVITLSFECLEFRGNKHLTVCIKSDVKWNHTDRVAGDELFYHLADASMDGILIGVNQVSEVAILSHFTIE